MCHTADTLKSAIERLEALEKKLEAISEIACSEDIKDKCN
jgi:hypothetical protein